MRKKDSLDLSSLFDSCHFFLVLLRLFSGWRTDQWVACHLLLGLVPFHFVVFWSAIISSGSNFVVSGGCESKNNC
jgi:hypothetical protein